MQPGIISSRGKLESLFRSQVGHLRVMVSCIPSLEKVGKAWKRLENGKAWKMEKQPSSKLLNAQFPDPGFSNLFNATFGTSPRNTKYALHSRILSLVNGEDELDEG